MAPEGKDNVKGQACLGCKRNSLRLEPQAGARTMLKRPDTSQEVAACVLFLASEEASYVTGTCLFVDGGFTAL